MTADVASLMKGIQGQLDAKNKELADLKASCNKMSKVDARRIQDLTKAEAKKSRLDKLLNLKRAQEAEKVEALTALNTMEKKNPSEKNSKSAEEDAEFDELLTQLPQSLSVILHKSPW